MRRRRGVSSEGEANHPRLFATGEFAGLDGVSPGGMGFISSLPNNDGDLLLLTWIANAPLHRASPRGSFG